MTRGSTWMNLDDMLSETGQTLKDKCSMVPLIEGPTTGKFIEMECRIEVTRSRGRVK